MCNGRATRSAHGVRPDPIGDDGPSNDSLNGSFTDVTGPEHEHALTAHTRLVWWAKATGLIAADAQGKARPATLRRSALLSRVATTASASLTDGAVGDQRTSVFTARARI